MCVCVCVCVCACVCVCSNAMPGDAQACTTKQEKRHQERHAFRHRLPKTTDSHRCQTYGCSFLSSAGHKNHRCVKQARPTVLDSDAFHYSCLQCQRKIRRPQDLNRQKCRLDYPRTKSSPTTLTLPVLHMLHSRHM